MSRPTVLLGLPAEARDPAKAFAPLALWLRGQGPRPAMLPAPPPSPQTPPPGALLVVNGLEPWADGRVGRLLRRRDLKVVTVLGRPPALDWPEYVDGPTRSALTDALAASALVLVPGEAAAASLTAAMPAGATARVAVEGAIPSGLAGVTAPATADLSPYVLAAGPTEARANTALLLHLWRDALAKGVAMPRLVLLSGRGRQIEEAAPLLDWNEALRPHVAEAPPLSGASLTTLVAGAHALLAPDFGAPDAPLMRDAARLGCPVVAADTPEARALGIERRLSPLDGPGWRSAIAALGAPSPGSVEGADLPDWPSLMFRLGAMVPP